MNLVLKFKTAKQLIELFNDDKMAHQYLASERWKDGAIICPHCEHDQAYVYKDGIKYKCQGCCRQFTAKTNTFMSDSKLKTVDWLLAMWMILHKKGISSIQLGKDLGVTQKTAWFILHKIRVAMGNEVFEQMEGTVEIDEAFVGGASRFKHKDKRMKYNPGRGWRDKQPVLGMLQRNGKVRAMPVKDVLMLTIYKQVLINVKGGADIMGDGFLGYRALEKVYNVKCVDHGKGQYVDGDCHTNTIEGFWSQMKRGLKSTYHQVSRRHLNKYVQEFVFKYNHRNLDIPQQIGQILCQSNLMITNKKVVSAW